MSIEVNWETATSGPDGEALAERIRSFIHDKFQQTDLPRFIRSVEVHAFDFGTIAPELEIKDFCEPFADFYEEEDDEDGKDDEDSSDAGRSAVADDMLSEAAQYPEYRGSPFNMKLHSSMHDPTFAPAPLRSPLAFGDHLTPPFLPRAGTPGIPGGTSNLGHHLMSLGGLSGTQTPLAAVAGGNPFTGTWSDGGLGRGEYDRSERLLRGTYQPHPLQQQQQQQRSDTDVDTNSASRPSTATTLLSQQHSSDPANSHTGASSNEHQEQGPNPPPPETATDHPILPTPRRMGERRPEDFQILCRVKYAGDIRLSLTAEILLDYPMPSFVGLPLKLNVTGVSFDGVAVIAYIRKRIHFCFLAPEDADTLVGAEGGQSPQPQQPKPTQEGHEISSGVISSSSASRTATATRKPIGGLLEEIRVESEIGRKEDGKQVLKNVGKVERFVLAQVRRIFEEEFVYPSYWTFLV